MYAVTMVRLIRLLIDEVGSLRTPTYVWVDMLVLDRKQ